MSDNCPYLQQINRYHDGELAPEQRTDVEAHIAACPVCRSELRSHERISGLLRGLNVPDAPDHLLARLHVAALRERTIMRMAKILTSAAAAIIVICALWLRGANGNSAAYASEPWEQTAITLNVASTDDEPQQFAQWVVEDLSLENGYEQD